MENPPLKGVRRFTIFNPKDVTQDGFLRFHAIAQFLEPNSLGLPSLEDCLIPI